MEQIKDILESSVLEGISAEELVELYRDAATERYDNSADIWEYVDEYGDCVEKEFTIAKKKMILRLFCKNLYSEENVVHACINEDISGGFVLTTSAICLYRKDGLFLSEGEKVTSKIISYTDIESVEEKPFCIRMKDDSCISLEPLKCESYNDAEVESAASEKDKTMDEGELIIRLGVSFLSAMGSSINNGCWRLRDVLSNYLNAVAAFA